MPTPFKIARTCAVLATGEVGKLESDVVLALRTHDYAEIRVDYLNEEDLEMALKRVARYSGRLVLTLRSEEEGGRFLGSDEKYAYIVGMLAQVHPMLVDVEYRRYEALFDQPIDSSKVLISIHDFISTPSLQSLKELFRNMSELSDIVKIVTTANEPGDAARIMALYEHTLMFGRDNTELIAFAMGVHGKRSRGRSGIYGPFTYVAFDKVVVPGMMTERQLQEECRRQVEEMKFEP